MSALARPLFFAGWVCPAFALILGQLPPDHLIAALIAAILSGGLLSTLPARAFRAARWITTLLLPLTCLWIGYASLNGGGPTAADALTAIANTNPSEASTALRLMANPQSLSFCFVHAALLAASYGCGTVAFGAATRTLLATCLLLITIGAWAQVLTADTVRFLPTRNDWPNFPYGSMADLVGATLAHPQLLHRIRRVQRRVPIEPRVTQPVDGIFIVGETFRFDRDWSGLRSNSGWQTLNTRFDAGLGVFLPKVCASADATAISVPMLLTGTSPEHNEETASAPSGLARLDAAGYATAWISNQDENVFESEHRNLVWRAAGGAHDEIVLPIVSAFLNRRDTRNKGLIVHLIDSHAAYLDRYPTTPEPSGLDVEQAEQLRYHRANEHTLAVLVQIAAVLDALPRPAYAVYVSDHGENLLADHNGLHFHVSARTSSEAAYVPSFVFWNDAFRQAYDPGARLLRDLSAPSLAHVDVYNIWMNFAGLNVDLTPTPDPKDSRQDQSDGLEACRLLHRSFTMRKTCLRDPPSEIAARSAWAMNALQTVSTFRPDIEGLRGMAVLLVVGCHCGIRWCAGGFVGVDVFFVLSGYLITGLLAAEYRTTSRIDLPRFFARRARRLLPGATLMLLAVTAIAAATLSPQEMEFTGRAARAAGLYMSNVFFDRGAADYFAPKVEGNPLLHTWSLGLEEQFYLVWPLLIMLAYRGSRPRQRSLTVLGAVVVFSFLLCLHATRVAPTVAFYELPARAWELAAGASLAILPASWTARGGRCAGAVGFGGVGLILGTAALLQGGGGFPGWIALFPVIGTLGVLFAGAVAPQCWMSVGLGTTPLQFIGSRSYSWYLWHWPFIVFAGILFPEITVYGKIAAVVAALLIAALTYRLVEQPVRQSRSFASRSALTLGAAAAAIALSVTASFSLLSFGQAQRQQDRKYELIGAASNDKGDLPSSCFSAGPSVEVKVCEFGARVPSPSMVLFGDSHAMQWFDPLLAAAKLEKWRLITVLKIGCAASDTNPQHISAAADHCKQWRTRATQMIIGMHPSAVVMASYNGVTLRGDDNPAPPLSADDVRSGTRRTLEELSHAGAPIVVLRDTPLPPFDIPACVARLQSRVESGGSCDFDASVALNEAAHVAELDAADGLPNIYFLDMNDLICRGRYCPATQNGIPIYRDLNHMTATFTETLAPDLRTRLFQLLREAPARARPLAAGA